MKKAPLLIIAFLFLTPLKTAAQNNAVTEVCIDMDTVKIGSFEECYKILRDNYIVMLKSDTNQKYQALIDELIDKSNYIELNGDKTSINILSLIDWMHENVEKTDFKNHAAMAAHIQTMQKAGNENIMANLDLHKYSKEVGKVYGSDVLTKVADELVPIYGNKFHF